jgi:hypothetical protein
MATSEEITSGADRICDYVAGINPFFIGRNGSTEMEVIHFWHVYRKHGHPYPPAMLDRLERGGGIWPTTQESCDAWAQEYVKSLQMLDGLAAGWYKPYKEIEADFLTAYASKAFRTPLRSLEPYYVEPKKRWTRYLNGRKVAVVSSFADSIQAQLWSPNVSNIWSGVAEPETILPITVQWSTIRTYYSPKISTTSATSWANAKSWEDAVKYVVEEVLSTDAEIVLIGCGALGMCIGGRLRLAGRSVILLGGAIQVLFGIKGQRWASHDVISKFWNSAWVYPGDNETPGRNYLIEGGCYWKGSAPSSTPR